mmetsp:Transcript_17082/g.41464  ORF Transcript_17082/g.41464 Transcript_17082/m.41464 type:complete len:206 (+) Transcript_17082:118-735(+)
MNAFAAGTSYKILTRPLTTMTRSPSMLIDHLRHCRQGSSWMSMTMARAVSTTAGTQNRLISTNNTSAVSPPSTFSTMRTATAAATSMLTSRSMSSSTTEHVSSMSSSGEDIEQLIGSHKVVLFSKTYCPFCKQSQVLFEQQLKVPNLAIVQLDTLQNGADIQKKLNSMYGQSTVPFVFVNQTLIGGNSDAQKLAKSGKLEYILED